MTLGYALRFAAGLVLLTACGDDAPPSTPDSGGTDSGTEDASLPPNCTADPDCDDGNPCNGTEMCAAGRCTAGILAANGTDCDADDDSATTDFCVDGLCAPTRCGDGVVDTGGGEACDDANEVSGDGCDDCELSCEGNEDCDDGLECTGMETCNTATSVCMAGPLAADDTPCNAGLGACQMGVCVPSMCTETADCDDLDPCNGQETCDGTMACQLGAEPGCDDMSQCTADRCDPIVPGGCVFELVDMDGDGHAPDRLACGDDCDDDDPSVYPMAPDTCDRIDNDCDGSIDEGGATPWYADCDGDSYAPTGATTLSSCAEPPPGMTGCPGIGGSWTTREPADPDSTDCNDANPTVNPAQAMFQSTAIPGAPEAIDFDYNCDTVEEAQRGNDVMVCEADPTSVTACTFSPGWINAVPECGGAGAYISNPALCTRGAGGATCNVLLSASRLQRCR